MFKLYPSLNTIIGKSKKKKILELKGLSIGIANAINPINIPNTTGTDASLNKLTWWCSQYVYNNAIAPNITEAPIAIPPATNALSSKILGV